MPDASMEAWHRLHDALGQLETSSPVALTARSQMRSTRASRFTPSPSSSWSAGASASSRTTEPRVSPSTTICASLRCSAGPGSAEASENDSRGSSYVGAR